MEHSARIDGSPRSVVTSVRDLMRTRREEGILVLCGQEGAIPIFDCMKRSKYLELQNTNQLADTRFAMNAGNPADWMPNTLEGTSR